MKNPKKRNTREKLKFHLLDSTAIVTESNPAFGISEVYVAKMSIPAAINARLFAMGTIYGGVGLLYSYLRDYSMHKLKINDETKEWKRVAFDSAYTCLFNLFISGPMYMFSQLAAGEKIDIKEAAIATGMAMLVGSINGIPMGYSVDIFRDLTGIKECNRTTYPNYIKNKKPSTKKGIAIGLTTASLLTMGLIYTNPPKQEFNEISAKLTTENKTIEIKQDSTIDNIIYSKNPIYHAKSQ